MRKFITQIMILSFFISPDCGWADNNIYNHEEIPLIPLLLCAFLILGFLFFIFIKWQEKIDNKKDIPEGLVFVAFGLLIADVVLRNFSMSVSKGLLKFEQKARYMALAYCFVMIIICSMALFVFCKLWFLASVLPTFLSDNSTTFYIIGGAFIFLSSLGIVFYCFSLFYLLYPKINQLFK